MVVLGLMVKFKITSKWIRRFRLSPTHRINNIFYYDYFTGGRSPDGDNKQCRKKLALLVREISWTKNIVIIERCKEREKTGDVREILIFSWLDETEVMEESNLLWRGVGK